MNCITIKDKKIGEGEASFIIAEIAQAHDGSLGFAYSFIDAVAECGADAVKFQTHIAGSESTEDEKFRIPMSGQDRTRYEYWKRMEFTKDQWLGLSNHARKRGLIFLSSAFSIDAVALLDEIGMPAWKVGSGEFKSVELLQSMMATGKPILYSTGMSQYDEVDSVVKEFESLSYPHCIFQCTSMYPTPLESVGLNVIDQYKQRYACPIGLSDHSGSIFPALAAVSRNVDLLELHVTYDKRMYGPDTVASVTFEELSMICQARDAIHIMNTNPVDKDNMAQSLKDMRGMFTKSIAFESFQKAGTVITDEMLTPKKPGTGIPYADRYSVIGRTLKVDATHERLLQWKDITDET